MNLESDSLLSAQAIPVDPSYRLRLKIYAMEAQATDGWLRWTVIQPDGTIQNSSALIRFSAITGTKVLFFRIGTGRFIGASVTVGDSQPEYGTLYAELSLLTGEPQDFDQTLWLTAGYISLTGFIAWPTTIPQGLGTINPAIVAQLLPNPAIGNNLVFTPSIFPLINVTGLTFTYVCSATVANRIIRAYITLQSTRVWSAIARKALTANEVYTVCLTSLSPLPDDTTESIYLPLPPDRKGKVYILETDVDGLEPDDQISDATIFVQTDVRPV